MKEKTLYVVEGWVDFPSSEYGAMYCVIANSDLECENILRSVASDGHLESYGENIMPNIHLSRKVSIQTNEKSGMVGSFVT